MAGADLASDDKRPVFCGDVDVTREMLPDGRNEGETVESPSFAFVMVPNWLLFSGVSDRAVRLFCVLALYARSDYQRRAFASRSTLSRDLSCSVDTVDRSVMELLEVGAIVREHRTSIAGDNASNCYWLCWPRTAPSTKASDLVDYSEFARQEYIGLGVAWEDRRR